MKRLVIIAALLAAIISGVFLYKSEPLVEVATPTRGQAVQAVYATGTVEPEVMLPIAARASARLIELNADEGMAVQEGQQLARLENTDLLSNITDLQAREKLALSEYNRRLSLGKSGFAAKEIVEQAKTAWESAKAAVQSAKAQAGYFELIAPADGTIIKRDGEIGELIALNQPVFWLATNAPLRITTEVDEEDIALVKVGQKVLIRADAFPGEIFHGEVQAITPKGDPVARSYRVRVSFTETTPLLNGMTAETNIIIREEENALLIPAGALEQGSVWVVENGKAEKRKIEIGAKGATQVEVLSGLADDSTIIIQHEAELKEGESVRTKERE